MRRKFYHLENDRGYPGRWHLSDLRDAANVEYDGREFTYGNRIDSGPPFRLGFWKEEGSANVVPPLTLYRSYEGTSLDFTYTDDSMPVATQRVADILGAIVGDDIQRFPVRVDRMNKGYEIINVVALADCLDVERSDVTWWEEGNDIRPELAGLPWTVHPVFIDPTRVGDHHMFRIKTYTSPIIVSDVVKKVFEEAQVSGVLFTSVS